MFECLAKRQLIEEAVTGLSTSKPTGPGDDNNSIWCTLRESKSVTADELCQHYVLPLLLLA
jgi:hypothetical protein